MDTDERTADGVKKLIHAMVAYLYCSTMSKHQATWARFPTTAYLNGGATFQVVNGLAGGGELHGPSFITLKGSRDQATGSFVVRAEDAASEVQLLLSLRSSWDTYRRS